ncbi:MAG: 3-hydroxyacyl-CoA dehydrogenase [Alphaproteobacteria bacterium]|nr:3-hydroxyacyl-CoA dehydrogenase [Alphaproteobacteria bacterium]
MPGLTREMPIAIIGAGTMGAGIAQVAAAAGHPVLLFDARQDAPARAIEQIKASLARLVERKRMTEADASALAARIRPCTALADLKGAGLAIEAIVEDMAIKKALFTELESLLGPDAVLATNTSSLSITELAGGLKRPERVAGMHFFNPAPVMPLVEIIRGFATGADVAQTVFDTAKAWGKKPVHVKSTPGFLGNRVARPFYGEALRTLEESATDVATYDALIREAGGFRMGAFELLDLVGIDVNWAVTNSVHDAYFHDPRYKPFRIQGEMVAAGRLGRKTKLGFYDYREGAPPPQPQDAAPAPAPAHVTIEGDLGPAASLEGRADRAVIAVRRLPGAGALVLPECRLVLSDGRTATERMAQEGGAPLVLFDLALDYAVAPRIAIAAADQAPRRALTAATGFFQALGMKISVVDDIPGLIVMRTVAMLSNFGFDAVHAGIADAAGVDLAMQAAFNYPLGPVTWAERIGLAHVAATLDNIARAYGEDRYRASPLLRRRAAAGLTLSGTPFPTPR